MNGNELALRALYKITHFLNMVVVEDHMFGCFALKSIDKHADPAKPIDYGPARLSAIGTIEELLECLLRSEHIFVPQQKNVPFGPLLYLRQSNPFYGMAVEEALVKVDLES